MTPAESVIGAITLGGKDAYWRVADLIKPEDFADRWFADVFRVMGEIAKSSVELDVTTIMAEMERQGIGDLAEVIDCASHTPGCSAVRTYAELVKREATERRVRAICAEGAKTGDVTSVQAGLSALLNAQPAHAVHAADALNRMWKGVMARYEAGDTFSGLLTGIPLLDEWTGGLQPGRVYGIGARAKMGKTILAMGISAHVALAGRPVGVWSLEMSDEELMQRMVCAVGGVRSILLQRPKLLDEDKGRPEDEAAMSRLNVAIKALKASPLHISDRTDVTIEEIEAQARQMHSSGQLDLLCIDYLGLLRLPKMDRHDLAIGHVTRRVKIIAKELRIPVLLVLQLNRGSEHGQAIRTPRPSDARDSGSIEQDLDALLLLHRPSYYDKKAAPGLRLDLALQRNGPTGLIHMHDELDRCRFTGGTHEWVDGSAPTRDDDL